MENNIWADAEDDLTASTADELADENEDLVGEDDNSDGDRLETSLGRLSQAEDSDEDEGSDADEDSDVDEDSAPFDPMVHVQTGECVKCDVSKRFGVKASCYFLAFRDIEGIKNLEAVGRAGIGKVIDVAFNQCSPEDVVGLEINHPALDTEILIPFAKRELTTVDKVMEVIASVQQSRRDLAFNCNMIIKATVVTPPSGGGYHKMSDAEFYTFFNKHSTEGGGNIFIKILNTDSSCFFRAVVVAQARIKSLKWGEDVNWSQIRQGGKYNAQTQEADLLKAKAGLTKHPLNQPCGIPEIRKVQDVMILEGFQLKIFSHSYFDASIFDDELEGLEYLYIYHHHNHFTPMSSPRILFGKNYYCDLCQHSYSDPISHVCPRICSFCRLPGPCLKGVREKCTNCSRFFPSHSCFLRHKESRHERPHHGAKKPRRKQKDVEVEKATTCELVKRCVTCSRLVSPEALATPAKHRCGTRYCQTCKIHIPVEDKNHSCHMQIVDKTVKLKRKNPTHNPKDRFLFYDFETSAEKPIGDKIVKVGVEEYSLGPILEHEPNLCIVRKICLSCKDFWLARCDDPTCYGHECERCVENKPSCEVCGEHYREFSGPNTRNDFCDFLFKEEHRGITAIAHNGRGSFIPIHTISIVSTQCFRV